MAKATVVFSVTESSGVRVTWLDVNEEPLELHNGKGSVKLEKGQPHELRWYFLGNEGDSIAIEGKQGGATIVEVKKSTIPPGKDRHANNRAFITKS